MFKYIKEEKYRIIITMILYTINAIIVLIPFDYLGDIINKISSNTITYNELKYKAIVLLILSIVFYFLNATVEIITFSGYMKAVYNFQKQILVKILKQSPKFFDKISIGEVMGRLTSDVNNYIATFYGWGLYCFNVGVLNTLVIFIYTIYKVDLRFTILINIPYILATLFIIFVKKQFTTKYEKMGETFDEISKKTLESIKGIRIVKAHNMTEKLSNEYRKRLKKYAKVNFQFFMYHNYAHILNSIAIALSYIFLIIYGYYAYKNNITTFGALIGVTLVMTKMAWPYTVLNNFIISIFEFNMGLNRINEVLNAKDEVVNSLDNKKLEFSDKIEFRNFSFSYENKKALDNISFTLNKGETLGIIGKTGSGKTTLIKQFLRLFNYKPKGIYIDGIDINEYDIKSLRSNFGYSSQEYYIFSKTLKENILFYRNLDDELDDALEIADLKKDVINFNDGVDTVVGENGVSLSGGQKQRLSIARAIISDPNILILDDSLSALDINTEKNIIKNLKENRKGKTNIIVSHRISSIYDADKIIVLNNGKIENIGTHNELLNTSSWYKALYEYQEKRYKVEK